MPDFPQSFAADRDWGFPELVSFPDYPALGSAWEFSKAQLRAIRSALEVGRLVAEIETVTVVGSLARMEASPQSDCDLIVILKNAVPLASPDAKNAYESVWEALAPLSLGRPKSDGIYAAPSSPSQLLNSASLGKVNEDLHTFGTRFQFLLEVQPVYRSDASDRLTHAVLERYASEYVAVDPDKEWSYLLNDLIRYFRSLCITYQWEGLNQPGVWRWRNIKARHSRLVMYAGLLLLLGECSREKADKIGWIHERLKLTPLERIASVYAAHEDPGFSVIAHCYETFLSALKTPGFRRQLDQSDHPESPLARESEPQYAQLKRNSDALLAELLRFVLERRDSWSQRFFEYLIF